MTDERLQELYRQVLDARDAAERAQCPAPEALLALVERRGGEGERLATLDHVMACPACLHDFEMLRAVRSAEVALPVRRWRPVTVALAASLLIAVAGGIIGVRSISERADVMRGGEGGGVLLIAPARLPTAGAPLVLRWHAVPSAISYSVEVLASDGTVVGSAVTPDTTFTISDSARLIPGERYLWWVRAHMPDGSERRSAMQPLGAGGEGER